MIEMSDYIKIADSIKKKCASIVENTNNICESIVKKEFQVIPTYEGKLASASRGLPDAINRLISSAGNDPTEIHDLYVAESCDIAVKEDIICVRFGRLLPHREKRGVETYTSSAPYIRAFYREAETKLKNIYYKEPVIFAFIHHYATDKDIVDHDNLVYKPFIDAISVFVLKDDSPRQCAHYMDFKMDNKTFSEIRVLPRNKFFYTL